MGKKVGVEVKLMYEDNMIEMALQRRKLTMLKNGGSLEEEEVVKRKFIERGLVICDYCTRERCNQHKGNSTVCQKTHFKRILRT
jgi:hypothetical protein